MNSSKKRFFWMMLTGLWLMCLISPQVRAESTSLSVKANLPGNQFNKDVSYFYLKMAPGEKQDLEVTLFNSSAEESTAEITLTSATTNDSGLIDYNMPDKKTDKSNLYPFHELASAPQEVKIPAKGEQNVKISLKMPAEEYDGMILGGINIKAKKTTAEKEAENKKQSGGMRIENEINYAIAVALIENENLVKTDMTLLKVFADQTMGYNTTKVTLQNPTAAVMENVTLEGKVYKKGQDQVLYENKVTEYRMAPNSSFDFGIPIGNERYKAGDYVLKLTAISDPRDKKDGEKQVWEFEEDFSISREEARKLNESAVDLPKDYTPYYLTGGAVAFVVLTLILLLVSRKKKQNQELKRKRKKRPATSSRKRR